MPTLILQVDPSLLSNPDLDIRYVLPDLLIERSGGRLVDGGYDYVGPGTPRRLSLFLQTDDIASVIADVIEVLKSERVLGNDLSKTPVAIEDGESFQVVYPLNFARNFWRSAK